MKLEDVQNLIKFIMYEKNINDDTLIAHDLIELAIEQYVFPLFVEKYDNLKNKKEINSKIDDYRIIHKGRVNRKIETLKKVSKLLEMEKI